MSKEESKSAGVSGQERAAITVVSEARWQQTKDLLTCVTPGWHSSASGERQLPPTPGSESHRWEFTGQEQAFRQADRPQFANLGLGEKKDTVYYFLIYFCAYFMFIYVSRLYMCTCVHLHV